MSKSSKKGPAVAALYEAMAEHAPGEAIPAEALRVAEEKDAASEVVGDEQASSDAAATADSNSVSVAVEVEPWRTFALCLRAQTVAFRFGTVVYIGGELEEDPQRVETLRSCDGFRMVDVLSEKHAEELRSELAKARKALSEAATSLGYKLVRHGDRIERR